MLKNKLKKEKGFVILIAILVSMILLSIGAFIASIATREIMLSSSAKQSQAAFFAADSVLECALYKEFKGGGFLNGQYALHDVSNSLICNGKKFDWFSSRISGLDGEKAIHVYYISLSNSIDDGNSNGLIAREEIEDDVNTSKKPYVKLIVEKSISFEGDSRMQVYGHNFREGATIIERAIEVVW